MFLVHSGVGRREQKKYLEDADGNTFIIIIILVAIAITQLM